MKVVRGLVRVILVVLLVLLLLLAVATFALPAIYLLLAKAGVIGG